MPTRTPATTYLRQKAAQGSGRGAVVQPVPRLRAVDGQQAGAERHWPQPTSTLGNMRSRWILAIAVLLAGAACAALNRPPAVRGLPADDRTLSFSAVWIGHA